MAATVDQTVTVEGRSIKLTNLDKVLYPATQTTKADVLAYYAQVALVMLPHLRDRPATRKRWPDGMGTGDKKPTVFFNKDLAKGTPDWVQRYKIEHRDHDNYYPVINDLATLTWLAQLAALEIHVPQWKFTSDGQPRNPDRLVLDLDPGPGVTLFECAEIAVLARSILRDIGHDPVPVTSGSKGIHLYAPLDGSLSTLQASDLARELAVALESEHRDRVISSMKRSERDGKVFIDWSQNNGAKTTVSPYSMRGRERPTVAAPRTWEELASAELGQVDYTEMESRIVELGDLMAPMADYGSSGLDRLARYRSMRDAQKTPEPVPPSTPDHQHDGQSFVIQEHHARRLHYDFRLERDGVLVSWAVPKAPPTDPKINHLAVQTEDHPLEYGSFEGEIPKGEYGGGKVQIWDSGTYRLHKWREGKEVIVTLFGRPDGGLGGVRKFALIHTGSGSDQPEKNWLIHLMQTDPEDITLPEAVEAPRPGSVEEPPPATDGQSHAEAGEVNVHDPVKGPPPATAGPARPRGVEERSLDHRFPEHVEPMLATLTDAEHFGDETDWAFEMKWDGVRTVAYLADGRVELRSRKGRDDTAAYFDVADQLAQLDVETAILDGEVVVLDHAGRPRFGLLQNRINLTRPGDIHRVAASYPAQLMLFDILELNGRSLLKKPYLERRAVLDDVIRTQPGSRIHVPPIFEGDLSAAMETSNQLQLEGVVAKRRSSTYQPGQRSRSWLKIKLHKTQEVVIGGWRAGQGRREGGVGSLLIGVPASDGLRYLGRVGSGFNDRQLDEIEALLKPLARKTSPLIDVPRSDARDAHWVTPSLVGEVTYGELTEPGRLRHPVWRGLRSDKSPADVRWEAPS